MSKGIVTASGLSRVCSGFCAQWRETSDGLNEDFIVAASYLPVREPLTIDNPVKGC
jgi:hypothetical protein